MKIILSILLIAAAACPSYGSPGGMRSQAGGAWPATAIRTNVAAMLGSMQRSTRVAVLRQLTAHRFNPAALRAAVAGSISNVDYSKNPADFEAKWQLRETGERILARQGVADRLQALVQSLRSHNGSEMIFSAELSALERAVSSAQIFLDQERSNRTLASTGATAAALSDQRIASPHARNQFFTSVQGVVDANLPRTQRKQMLENLGPANVASVQTIFRNNGLEPWFEVLPPRVVRLNVPLSLKLDDHGFAHLESRKDFSDLLMRLRKAVSGTSTIPIAVFNANLEGLLAFAARRNFVDEVGAWTGQFLASRPAIFAVRPGYGLAPITIVHEILHLVGLEHSRQKNNLMASSGFYSHLNQKQIRQIRDWVRFHLAAG